MGRNVYFETKEQKCFSHYEPTIGNFVDYHRIPLTGKSAQINSADIGSLLYYNVVTVFSMFHCSMCTCNMFFLTSLIKNYTQFFYSYLLTNFCFQA